jgi:hypothetical protein
MEEAVLLVAVVLAESTSASSAGMQAAVEATSGVESGEQRSLVRQIDGTNDVERSLAIGIDESDIDAGFEERVGERVHGGRCDRGVAAHSTFGGIGENHMKPTTAARFDMIDT